MKRQTAVNLLHLPPVLPNDQQLNREVTVTEERQLISRAQNGDMMAFRQLVEQHRRNVYYLALDLSGHPQDAEDLTQEVFIRAFRFLGNFRGDAKFGSWLYRITVNSYTGSRRKKQMRNVPLQNTNSETAASPETFLVDTGTANPEDAAAAGDIQQHIRQALVQLSPRERTVFVLRHYCEMPLRDIAETLDIAEGTVKSLLFRAIKRLQKALAFYKPDLGL